MQKAPRSRGFLFWQALPAAAVGIDLGVHIATEAVPATTNQSGS
jgi:hypothetical protein